MVFAINLPLYHVGIAPSISLLIVFIDQSYTYRGWYSGETINFRIKWTMFQIGIPPFFIIEDIIYLL